MNQFKAASLQIETVAIMVVMKVSEHTKESFKGRQRLTIDGCREESYDHLSEMNTVHSK